MAKKIEKVTFLAYLYREKEYIQGFRTVHSDRQTAGKLKSYEVGE